MPQFGPNNAQCHVFTQKEGILSAIAHDLELEVTDFTIDANDNSIRAHFKSVSLRMLHALKDGRPLETLSEKDKKEIQASIAKDVLDVASHPEIEFVSSSVTKGPSGGQVSGTLTLHGVSKSVTLNVRAESGSYIAELAIHQPDYNIKPYSALLGTLKVKAGVRVRISVPQW